MDNPSQQSPERCFKHFDDQTDLPVIQPLCTLDVVMDWQAGEESACVATVPRPNRTLPLRTRTLVCHDMKGGYMEDRFLQGVCSTDCYRLSNWSEIDIFVYFSHRFVTIPPPAWTNAGHRNGVMVLGTIITEWSEGSALCERFLANDGSRDKLVRQLVAIALYYGFDGWLINIENEIQAEHVAELVKFVRELSLAMHASVPHSLVLWYDSVIRSGSLCWQNELNDENCAFFDACDGIFLNYTWTEENVAKTAALAETLGRRQDVYLGVDVFGRGCHGGGGFNTQQAVKVAREANISTAIFGQGWVFQELPTKDFEDNERKFWTLLKPFFQREPKRISSLPLCSTFCQGWGSAFYLGGRQVPHSNWTNLAIQQLQPVGPAQGVNYDRSAGVCGGGCLLLDCSQPAVYVTLFPTDISLVEEFHLTYKCMTRAGYELTIVLEIRNGSEERYVLCGSGVVLESEIRSLSGMLPGAGERRFTSANCCYPGGTFSRDPDHRWETRQYSIPPKAGSCIRCISILILTSDSREVLRIPRVDTAPLPDIPGAVRLGYLGLLDAKRAACSPRITSLSLMELCRKENGRARLVLSWTCSGPSDYYIIQWKQDCWTLLGVTHATAYLAADLAAEDLVDAVLRVVPVYHGGLVPPDNQLPVLRV